MCAIPVGSGRSEHVPTNEEDIENGNEFDYLSKPCEDIASEERAYAVEQLLAENNSKQVTWASVVARPSVARRFERAHSLETIQL